jgi:hypothetical protein
MPKLPSDGSPYHTSTDEVPYGQRNVHHNRNICPDGKQIKEENVVHGTGNKPICDWCKAHPL